ncbi:unnamed protein product [Polarella glacialis]|uniref:Uncharacterized protein n=1 Tax=Polarella glacialis TaxID=89957 RepID=A0A813IJQ0_POLGL|nr:unnamed protein product [Polarella glacialis]
MDALTSLMIAAAVAYFVVALAGAVAVRFIARISPKWLQLCNATAGGVLIGVALCHMLAESAGGMSAWGTAISSALGGEADDPFPLGLFLAGVGFFLIISLEHLLGGHDHDTGHLHDEEESQDRQSSEINPEVESDGGIVNIKRATNTELSGFTTLVGVSVHSIIESIATGSAQSADTFGIIVLAVLFHKGFAAFAVASSLQGIAKSNVTLWWSLIILFALTGPIGILIGGICKASVDGQGSAALQCLASGTLLAVGMNELLMPALEDKGSWKRRKLAAAIFGFSAISLLAVWT